MLMSLIWLIVALVIIGAIFYAVIWFIDWVGLPEPFNKVAKIAVGLVALIVVVYILLDMYQKIPGAPAVG